ncbi:MAG: hypothetical protein NTY20_06130 [Candidatus Aenigmarchaeota archaeon]|nr:hypothetical protein [Candidatus Aenigmarchaeota archaeon]
MADEKKEEEKKPEYHSEIDSEAKVRLAKIYRKDLIDQGYSAKDAHDLAVLMVRKVIRENKIKRSRKDITDLQAKIITVSRIRPDVARNLEKEIRAEQEEIKKLSDDIVKIEKDMKKLEGKKELLGKGYFDIEQEQKKKLKGLEDIKKKLPSEEYEREKQKIEGFYKDVFETRAEDIKDLRKKAGVASRFTCDVCGKGNLYESYDKDTGQLTYKCTNKKCKVNQWKRKKLLPEEVYKDRWFVRNVPILKWKSRELAHARMTSESRVEELEKKYREGLIDKEELKEGKKRIKKEVYGDTEAYEKDFEAFKRNNPGATRSDIKAEANKLRKKHNIKDRTIVEKYGGGLRKFSHTGEDFVKKVIFIVALIGIGAVIAASLGNMWFFFGFLSVGLYFLTPPPNEIEHEGGPLSWGHMIPFAGKGGAHSGFAWIRSITKVAAIICFAYGFKSMGDIFNTFFIITCLAGYFSLKLTYSPERPGDFIESLLRFAILGCYFIPFIVFAGIFNSYVLAAIAFAFFAIPPMPETSKGQNLGEILSRGLSGQTAYYEMFDKLLFLGLMFFALLGSGVLGDLPLFGTLGWALTGTLKYTFIYFWIVSLIGGFFSPARERPLTGILFLGGATIIYGIGPGSQDIGSALLGQWWPSVNQAVTSISEPISKMFGQLGKTFGDAFLLLTNPVGYATQLMNGSYSNNPAGETGAYGLELSGFEVSPVFIEQPFMITTNIKNSGAYNAEGVAIALSVGGKAPESTTSTGLPGLNTVPNPQLKVGNNAVTISGIGINSGCEANTPWSTNPVDKNYICVHNYATSQGSNNDLKMPFIRQNIWQTVFSSDGINCSNSATYQLRKKSIPINITLSYKYQSDSKVPIEFISQAEWDRLAKLDQLNSRLQIIKSEYSSAPVQFPIGTPGLKNPILETQDFHIALNLMSNQQGGKISGIDSIVLNYPVDFELIDKCSPEGMPGTTQNGGKTVTWTNKQSGDQIFFCHFKALKQGSTSKLGTSPTKTYAITAHANYTYTNSQQKLVKVEFGSWCCTQETGVCTNDQKCCPEDKVSGKGICAPKTQNCGGGTGGTSTSGCCQNANDLAWYCSDVASAQDCNAAGATFVSNGVCNQTTGRCEAKS